MSQQNLPTFKMVLSGHTDIDLKASYTNPILHGQKKAAQRLKNRRVKARGKYWEDWRKIQRIRGKAQACRQGCERMLGIHACCSEPGCETAAEGIGDIDLVFGYRFDGDTAYPQSKCHSCRDRG